MFAEDRLYYRTVARDNTNKRNTLNRIWSKFKFVVIIIGRNLHEYLS